VRHTGHHLHAHAGEAHLKLSIALGLYVPSALVGLAQGVVPPAIPAMSGVFGVAPAVAAQVVTLQLLGRFATLVPVGMLADRVGGRVAMVAGAVLLTLAGVISALAPAFWVVLTGQLVSGVSLALWQVGRELSAIDLVVPRRRGLLLSTFFGVQSVTQALGPLFGGLTVDAMGVRAVFDLQAGVALGVLLTAVLAPGGPVPRRPSSRTPLLPRLADLDPRYRVTFLVLMLGTFAASLRQSTLSALLPLLGAGAGLSGTRVGALFGVVAAVNLVMIGPAGYISDRFGRKVATVPTAALAGLGFLLYPFAHGFAELAAVSAVVGVASGFGLGSMTTYTYDITPVRGRGAFQGVRRMAGDLGGLVGPSTGGVVASLFSASAAFLVFAPLHLVSALLLVVAARESLPRDIPSRCAEDENH
jgi:MFS family permease